MYTNTNNTIVYSPSDLCLFMKSPFASWMEHARCLDPEFSIKPDERDIVLSLLAEKGDKHELDILQKFKEDKFNVVEISDDNKDNMVADTISAIHSGADVIFQATLELSPFKGYADFLVKVPHDNGEKDSKLGNYHYEVWDAKLAKSVKPYFVVQLCCYTEMLEAIQGVQAKHIVVALGNGTNEKLLTNDYFHYYLGLKEQFLAMANSFDKDKMPDPYLSNEWGRWSGYVSQLLEDIDHLSRVATITKNQVKKIEQHGISTMQALAENSEDSIKGISANIDQRLKSQAAIQIRSSGKEVPDYEILPEIKQRGIGLAMLPPHSDQDLFFDIEGYPLIDGGLEYLWGVTYFDENGDRQFRDFWAHTQEQEKQAFQEFIEWVYNRWQQDPTMHIYHYANYEIAACRKLMGRYGVCENKVDQLLRNNVFIDLYTVVKNSMLIGEPRYSIKNVEHLYREARDTEVSTGSDSIVIYEKFLEEIGDDLGKKPASEVWQESKTLTDIRDYNIDDCDSTQELVDWLRERQTEASIEWSANNEPQEIDQTSKIEEVFDLRDKLLSRANKIKEGNQEREVLETLARSLEFHNREAKPTWWRLFDRLMLDADELLADSDSLAGCTRTADKEYKPTSRARNLAYTYSFDINQEFKHLKLSSVYVIDEDNRNFEKQITAKVIKLDLKNGVVVFTTSKKELPHKIALIPNEYINPEPIPTAIARVASDLSDDSNSHRALHDFLTCATPRIKGHKGGELVEDGDLDGLINVVSNLENSYLTIQGPPGCGKTHSGKHIIASLLKQSKRVAITSNSHKAIDNLLIGVAELVAQENITADLFKAKINLDEKLTALGVKGIKPADINDNITDDDVTAVVVGATAWGIAREELAGLFDYLFIDEAGQVAVANLIGMSQAADNSVLMGDQMQLSQPTQGFHPGKSGLSTLDYLMGDNSTIAEDKGVFLGTTYRMHSQVNQFISKAIYDNRLHAHKDNDRQIVKQASNTDSSLVNKEAGVVYIPVDHYGNTQSSLEEIEVVKKIVSEVTGNSFTDKDGKQHKISSEDILIVAPYNHQVNLLKQELDDKAKIGTIDKFQGQQAPVVILSMCASSASDSPRGLEFLLDKHRLNVAVSRAQSLAIVVASSTLTDQLGDSLKSMQLVNTFQMLKDYGK